MDLDCAAVLRRVTTPFPDARLGSRCDRLLAGAHARGTIRPHAAAAAAADPAGAKAASRFYHNPRVTPEHILSPARAACLAAGLEVCARVAVRACAAALPRPPALLVASDTTALDFGHLAGGLRVTDAGIGPIGSHTAKHPRPGFFAHATVCLGPGGATARAPWPARGDRPAGEAPAGDEHGVVGEHGVIGVLGVVGVLGAEFFARGFGAPDKHARDYKRLPAAETERAYWTRGRDRIAEALRPYLEAGGLAAARVLHVCDREADAYLSLRDGLARGIGLLYRSGHDRRARLVEGPLATGPLAGPTRRLSDLVAACAPAEVSVAVGRDGRGRPRRVVPCELRCLACALAPTRRARQEARAGRLPPGPGEVRLTVIDVREVRQGGGGGGGGGEALVHWRLLCSEPVSDLAHACELVGYYAERWRVERYFAQVKSRGMDLESCQVRSGAALHKITAMAMAAAVQVERLVGARDGSDLAPAAEVLGYDDGAALVAASRAASRAGTAVTNPHPPGTVAYLSWVCARLGGWGGYASSGQPGSRTMARGLERFAVFRAGFREAIDYLEKVVGND